jgi:electron transfer flavoprotein alpha subunit
MAGILVVGLVGGTALHRGSLEVAALGRRLAESLGTSVTGAVAGTQDRRAAEEFACGGMTELLVADPGQTLPPVAECQVAFLEKAARHCGASIILAPHTLDTGEWMPLLAARLGAAVVTDVQAVVVEDGQLLVTKPICGGAVIAEYALNRPVGVITVAPGTYESAMAAVPCRVTPLKMAPEASAVEVLEEISDASDTGPTLKQARTVIAGGLGVGSRDQWQLVTDAASALGAGIGATRAVVESGWVPSNCQVGYSGTKIAPDLYIAIGISGAVHHLAGITQAKTVVAINVDPTAEIFKVARFGVVGDAKVVVPAFTERVRELRRQAGESRDSA